MPQTLLFSATLPPWVNATGKKYFGDNVEKISLVGTQENRTSKTVQVDFDKNSKMGIKSLN